MNKVYFVAKQVEDKWSLCLIRVGVLHNNLSDLSEKRMFYDTLHLSNIREAQNYIDRMKNEGDTAEYKIIEGSLKYDFSNLDKLNQNKDE
jgi:hypothetical protein